MKKLIVFLLCLFPATALARNAGEVLDKVYGQMDAACTVDTDIDTGGANRIGPLTEDGVYRVICLDATTGVPNGSGVACECLAGGATVDASSANGPIFMAGESSVWTFKKDSLYLSCVPFADNKYLQACRLR